MLVDIIQYESIAYTSEVTLLTSLSHMLCRKDDPRSCAGIS